MSKHPYGFIKNILIKSEEAGLSYAQASAKYGIKSKSLHEMGRRYGISLKRSSRGSKKAR
jgi:hypothetical protein